MGVSIYFWIGFHAFIFFMLALDLGVFNKKAHKIEVKEALEVDRGRGFRLHYYSVFLFFMSLARPRLLSSLPVMLLNIR